jgi:hypothetical protein
MKLGKRGTKFACQINQVARDPSTGSQYRLGVVLIENVAGGVIPL